MTLVVKQAILEGLSPLAPRIAFLHIIRDTTQRGGGSAAPGGGGGGSVRTSVLVTLDSVEAAEGWAAMTAEGRGALNGWSVSTILYTTTSWGGGGDALTRFFQPSHQHAAELSLGGQLLYVSGLVLLPRRPPHPPHHTEEGDEGEEDDDAFLPCLKSLVDEVGASAAAAAEQGGGGGGGGGSPQEYAQLGTVYGA